MKRCAVFAAKSVTTEGNTNRTKKSITYALALAFALCGVFYWSDFSQNPSPDPSFGQIAKAQTKDETPKDDLCDKPLPQASIANPTLEVYKIEKLCNKPEKQQLKQVILPEDPKIVAFQEELEKILAGTPMEEMIEPISKQERTAAAFLVGIAFKESKFGVYSPKKNGAECFNFWGFKGKTNPTQGGYSCFSSPQEAVEIVGKKLEKFVTEKNLNTPAKMTIWKCGSSCAGHAPGSVEKWIADVSIHFYKLNKS